MRSITLVAATAAILLASNAEAQRPDRGERPQQAQGQRGQRNDAQRQRRPQLSMDQLKAAWAAQAGIVASGLELDEAQTEAVRAAYAKARTSHRMAAAALPNARGQDRERGRARDAEGQGADREARRAEARQEAEARRAKTLQMLIEQREKFEMDLAMVLEGQKLRYATEVLGTFNPQWDAMASTLVGFELQPEVSNVTLKLTENYIVETRHAREAAAVGGEGAREAMQSSRERLLTGVKGLLTNEQYIVFERTLGGQRGQRGQQADRGQRGERGNAAQMVERMMTMDADGDGRLSRDEVPERMAERFFDRMDEDGDGYIDEAEMTAMAERRMEAGQGRGGQGRGAGGNRRGGGNGGGGGN